MQFGGLKVEDPFPAIGCFATCCFHHLTYKETEKRGLSAAIRPDLSGICRDRAATIQRRLEVFASARETPGRPACGGGHRAVVVWLFK